VETVLTANPTHSLINPAHAISSVTITSSGHHEVAVAVAELLLGKHVYVCPV
jgi:hypothetical protein